jgi:hypothetical protein
MMGAPAALVFSPPPAYLKPMSAASMETATGPSVATAAMSAVSSRDAIWGRG